MVKTLTLEKEGSLVGNQVASKILGRVDQAGNHCSAEVNTLGNIIVDELGTSDCARRLALLHPIDQSRKDVVLGVKGDASSRGVATLTEDPRAGTSVAVVHARDAEEAEVVVDLGVRAREAQLLVYNGTLVPSPRLSLLEFGSAMSCATQDMMLPLLKRMMRSIYISALLVTATPHRYHYPRLWNALLMCYSHSR